VGLTYRALQKLLRELGIKVDTTSSDVARQSTLQSINQKITKCNTDSVTVSDMAALDKTHGTVRVTVYRDSVGLAKESTLQSVGTSVSSIDNKITKADTDKVKVISEVAYDGTNDLKKVSIRDDSVGLAKETTLNSILSQLDITLSQLRDALRPIRSTPTQRLSSQSISAGGTTEFTINNTDTDGYTAIALTVKATYDTSATQGLKIRWLYSPDGSNFDTTDGADALGNSHDLTFSAGATVQETIKIPILQPYVKIQLENLDGTYAVTVDAWTATIRHLD